MYLYLYGIHAIARLKPTNDNEQEIRVTRKDESKRPLKERKKEKKQQNNKINNVMITVAPMIEAAS